MSRSLKIAIVGDYNFTYYSHQATNLSLDHAAVFLDVDINYYWVRLSEAVTFKPNQFEQYDGVWIAPGPFTNLFYVAGIIKTLVALKIPTLITGEGFKTFVEVLLNNGSVNLDNTKLISENLVTGNKFEKITILPHSDAFIQLFEHHSTYELSSSRYSIYPQAISQLVESNIDIEAYNQFEDPEIISIKKHSFFVASSYCPQITSTRELPHPLVYTFIKACLLDK